jgi:hypothetical protein
MGETRIAYGILVWTHFAKRNKWDYNVNIVLNELDYVTVD